MCILSGFFPYYQKTMLRDNIFTHLCYLHPSDAYFYIFLTVIYKKAAKKSSLKSKPYQNCKLIINYQ